jgi:hypothetical protein
MSGNTDLPATEEQTDENNPAPIVGDAASSTEVKDWDIADDDHPLVRESGSKAMKARTEGGLGEFLSDFIYEADSAFVREYLQNSETACIRAAKYLIRNHPEYGAEWLTREIRVRNRDGERFETPDSQAAAQFRWLDGDLPEWHTIEVPRPMHEVVTKARDLGYDPTIEVTLHRDERRLVWEDNGIGMTAYEADKAFMTNFNSGSAVETDTGGKFGVGAKSHGLITGTDAGMDVFTRTRRTEASDADKAGFKFHAYLGGATAVKMGDDEMSDDFRGTLFEIPIQPESEGGPDISRIKKWVKKYSANLRVPVKYEEKRSGETRYDNEYGGTNFVEYHGNPPVVLERPGEFTAVAGPDISGSQYRNDCHLVSMPIDPNNRKSGKTMWSMRVQIHDEQGLIVAGPNRGKHKADVAELHGRDVPTPEPVGSRDSLQKDDPGNPEFFEYVSERLLEREWAEVADVAERLAATDKPWEVVQADPDDWRLFRKMVDYHGYSRTTNSADNFKQFIDKQDPLPDFSTDTASQVVGLFKEVEHAASSAYSPSKKDNRSDIELGELLADVDPDHVFMAASTGGAFMDRYEVVYNSFDDAAVVVINGARKYDTYEAKFGFHRLKHVPRTKDGETDLHHDFDVPDSVHESNKNKGSTGSSGKADEVAQRTLKFRTDSSNTSIDSRLTIETVQDRLDSGGRIGGHRNLILFTRGDGPNISDHYDMAKFAAIACVSKAELAELEAYDRVFSLDAYKEWSRSTVIATENGGRRADDLTRDDETVVLAYAPTGHKHRTVKGLLTADEAGVRTRVTENIVTNQYWYDEDDFDRDIVYGVLDAKTFERAKWCFIRDLRPTKRALIGWRPTHHRPSRSVPWSWDRLSGSLDKMRFKAQTPRWDDDSEVYRLLNGKSEGDLLYDLAMGLHDHHGIDPTDIEGGHLYKGARNIQPGDLTSGASSSDSTDGADDGDINDLRQMFSEVSP